MKSLEPAQAFPSHLLCARHQAQLWVYNSEPDRHGADTVGRYSPAFLPQLLWAKPGNAAYIWKPQMAGKVIVVVIK